MLDRYTWDNGGDRAGNCRLHCFYWCWGSDEKNILERILSPACNVDTPDTSLGCLVHCTSDIRCGIECNPTTPNGKKFLIQTKE